MSRSHIVLAWIGVVSFSVGTACAGHPGVSHVSTKAASRSSGGSLLENMPPFRCGERLVPPAGSSSRHGSISLSVTVAPGGPSVEGRTRWTATQPVDLRWSKLDYPIQRMVILDSRERVVAGADERPGGPRVSLETPLAAVRVWAEEHMAEVDRANAAYAHATDSSGSIVRAQPE